MKQKHESMEVDKERSGAAGKDRDSVRAAILEEAVIVCNFTIVCNIQLLWPPSNYVRFQVFSTLSFSGSALFSKWNRGFDVVIIDEAAQAVSPVLFSSSV